VFEFAGSREGKYRRLGVRNKLGHGNIVGTKNVPNDFREGETKTQFQSLQVCSHATRGRVIDCVGRAGDYYPIVPSKRELHFKVYHLLQFVAEGGVNIMRPWSVFWVRPGQTVPSGEQGEILALYSALVRLLGQTGSDRAEWRARGDSCSLLGRAEWKVGEALTLYSAVPSRK